MRSAAPAPDVRLTYDDFLLFPADGKRLPRVEELTAEDGGTLTTPLLPGCGIDVRVLFRPTP